MQQSHTNFVLINLDDVGYGDFSYNGAYGYETPNIDKLASEGMQFTHFLAAQPISGASRAGLLTGCYPNRIGFHGAPGPNSRYGIAEEEMTIGEVLKQGDYSTAISENGISATRISSFLFRMDSMSITACHIPMTCGLITLSRARFSIFRIFRL